MAKSKRTTERTKPEAPDTSERDSPVDSRLAIPLDKDGKILLSNMRETNRSKLAELLRDPQVQFELGLTAGNTTADAPHAPASMALPAELMMPVVAGLSALDTILIARITNAPSDLVMRYGPYSREEREQIAPLLASVLAKHAGGMFAKYGEESALLLTLVTLTTAKIAAIKQEAETRRGPARVVQMAGQVQPPAADEPRILPADEPAPGGEL